MKKTFKILNFLIEYGLILSLFAVIAIAVLGKFGSIINKPSVPSQRNLSAAELTKIKTYCKSIGKIYDKDSGKCRN